MKEIPRNDKVKIKNHCLLTRLYGKIQEVDLLYFLSFTFQFY